ncbi:hypothetical protein [Agrobacterium rosae]|uniref:hypothetical protein n=1 Tax=Agrobacterium rosae TaxID=1972867 RepID=UPI0011AF9950|nr:hypothetical protein [Agrobacterium rosae]
MSNDNGDFGPVGSPPSDEETMKLLRNPSWAIGWALENVPDELFKFFTEYKEDHDDYLWSINMTAWIEHVRSK